ncbi:MAG: hypothetical protein PF518_16540 [Spirochaetaceae bacterium]|jgi:uncharacterized cysteine cluster protein YcgN (CxxCxxCC family)|nr:hypothetical protein [Spirochaetaceae bacterium]
MKINNPGLLIKSFLLGYKGEWESICNNCGACCYQKTEDDNGIIFIDFDSPCSNLNTKNQRCIIYKDRFKRCKECSRLGFWHALFARWLPADCGYVKKFRK